LIIRQLSNQIVNNAELRSLVCKSLCSLNLRPFEANLGPVLFNVFLDTGNADVLKLVKAIDWSQEFLESKTKKIVERILGFRANEPAKVPTCFELLSTLMIKKQELDEVEKQIVRGLLELLLPLPSVQKRCYKLIFALKDLELV
jgi:hypothetical protein